MADLADHSAHRRRVVAQHARAEAAEAEPLERRLLILRRADAALDERDREATLARRGVLAGLRLVGALAVSVTPSPPAARRHAAAPLGDLVLVPEPQQALERGLDDVVDWSCAAISSGCPGFRRTRAPPAPARRR